MSEPNRGELKPILIAFIAVIMAVGVVLLVERLIAHPPHLKPEPGDIFTLEIIILFLLIAPCLLGEILHISKIVVDMMTGKEPEHHAFDMIKGRNIFWVLTALAGSLFIFFGLIRIFEIPLGSYYH